MISSLLMVVCSFKKSRKVEAVFTFWRTKHMIKCSVKCQSQTKPKTKQCADDELKKELLERNLTPNVTPVFLSLIIRSQ